MLPDFKRHYSHQNSMVKKNKNKKTSMVLAQKQTHSSIEQNREPRNEPTLTWAINL